MDGVKIFYYEDDSELESISIDLSLIVEKYYKFIFNSRYGNQTKKIWSFKPNDETLFVNGNLRGKYEVLPPDANALLETVLIAKNLYPNLNIKRFYSKDLIESQIQNKNIVSVGGPSSNSITKYFLDLVKFPWRYIRETPEAKQILKNSETNEIKSRTYNKKSEVISDFGFFMRLNNILGNNKTIILITAMTTEGVYGTSLTFSSLNDVMNQNIIRMNNYIEEETSFATITKTKVVDKKIICEPFTSLYILNPSNQQWNLQQY